MYDIDALEIRNGRGKVAGLIETKREGWRVTPATEFQLECMNALAERAGVPGLLVEYQPIGEKKIIGEVYVYESIGSFTVTDLASGAKMVLEEADFKGFIENLPQSVARLRRLWLTLTPN